MNDQRNKFIDAWLQGEWDMTTLCREFNISRKTGYKWLDRFDKGGRADLQDRSRAPLSHPHAVHSLLAQLILEARSAHPTWGPLKLLAMLRKQYPEHDWPAASTVGELLRREGLSSPQRRRRQVPPYAQPFAGCHAANDLWCADFKGWFKTGDGQTCHPFTVTDAYSRYVLCIEALPNTQSQGVRPFLQAAFREFGLPLVIRTDNGAPFAGTGLAGLSSLDVWWIKLGIRHERIAPGRPQQNGRHERMHRTLKAEATQPAESNLKAQQRRFKNFRQVFNEVRPHAALDHRTPDEVYRASQSNSAPRGYPRRTPELEYPDGMTLRRVRTDGQIRWKGGFVFVSETLKGEVVALQEIDDDQWQLFFGYLQLAVRDRDNKVWQPPSIKTPATGKISKAKESDSNEVEST